MRLRFETKIFIICSIFSIVIIATISSILFENFKIKTIENFKNNYLALNNSIAKTLYLLDQKSNETLKMASLLILKDEKFFNRQTRTQLEEIAKKWGVSYLYIADGKTGNYLKSTCEPPEELPSVFSYCEDYKGLSSGKKEFEMTPLVFGKPDTDSFKFILFPSKKRDKIYEIALNAKYIGETLKNAVDSYKPIISVGLFAPNGDSLGVYYKDKYVGRKSKLDLTSFNDLFIKETQDNIYFFKKVSTETTDCCECNVHMNENGPYFYLLRTKISKDQLKDDLRHLVLIASSFFIFLSVICIFISKIISKFIVKRITLMDEKIKKIMETGNLDQQIPDLGTDEIGRLAKNFNLMTQSIKNAQNELLKNEANKTLVKIAEQISHDIRSPLIALEMFINSNIEKFNEESRILIREATSRIKDIANMLRNKKTELRKDHQAFIIENSGIKRELIFPIIERVISLKQIENRHRKNFKISFNVEKAYTSFATINYTEFSRILSNILNNAIESVSNLGKNIIIDIVLKTAGNELQLLIKDNGKHISNEILQNLFSRGFTTKTTGSGLGLFHAEQNILKWGGSIRLENRTDTEGVEVHVALPKTESPDWFAQEITILNQIQFIVLDDDNAIHEIWKQRINRFENQFQKNISILNFKDIDEAKRYLETLDGVNYIFLCDFEFIGKKENGIDIIKDLGNTSKSYLVTSHYEKEKILNEAIKISLRIIPKEIVPFIEIKLK